MAEHDQQFDTFEQWCNKASSWLTRHPQFDLERFRAICFDADGRLCQIGRDFMRARDEHRFPVRWLWPDQVGPAALALDEALDALTPYATGQRRKPEVRHNRFGLRCYMTGADIARDEARRVLAKHRPGSAPRAGI